MEISGRRGRTQNTTILGLLIRRAVDSQFRGHFDPPATGEPFPALPSRRRVAIAQFTIKLGNPFRVEEGVEERTEPSR